MNYLSSFAEHFTGLFQAAADQFVSFITGVIPLSCSYDFSSKCSYPICW